jgi:hypothetical protein
VGPLHFIAAGDWLPPARGQGPEGMASTRPTLTHLDHKTETDSSPGRPGTDHGGMGCPL